MSTLDVLALNASEYVPSPEVAKYLSDITFVPIIGPVAVGKSACMDQVTQSDRTFGRARSFTTRPRRPTEAESEYRFLPHNDDSINSIAAAVSDGDLVQYTVHPTTGYIYGSDLSDYSRPRMMLDMMASSVSTVRCLPFGRLVEVSLVAEPSQWRSRFNSRAADPIDARRRVVEGIASLQWSLDQGDSMVWVANNEGKLPQVAKELREIITGTKEPNVYNRTIGEQLLRALEELQW